MIDLETKTALNIEWTVKYADGREVDHHISYDIREDEEEVSDVFQWFKRRFRYILWTDAVKDKAPVGNIEIPYFSSTVIRTTKEYADFEDVQTYHYNGQEVEYLDE